jgi:integrase
VATIQKRVGRNGDITFRVQVRLRGAPVERATFTSKTAAKHWAQKIETDIRENRHFRTAEARRRTVAELIDRYIEQWLPQKAPSVVTQRFQLLWWREEIGDRILAELRPDVFIDARTELSKRLVPKKGADGKTTHVKISSGTINRYFAALSPVFTVAVRELGWLHENPLRTINKLKEPKGRDRFLDKHEIKQLLAACKNSKNSYIHLFVLLSLSTGMRKNEVLGLRWADFDQDMKQLTLHDTKNGEKRGIPVAAQALAELLRVRSKAEKKLKAEKRPKSDLEGHHIFPSRAGGDEPLDIRVPWETVRDAAKLSDFRIHDLRHTAASYLAMNGSSLLDIAHVLGHKSLDMVKRYAHLSPQHTAKTIHELDKRLFG